MGRGADRFRAFRKPLLEGMQTMCNHRRLIALLIAALCGALLPAAGCRGPEVYNAPDTRPVVSLEQGHQIAQWLRTEWYRLVPLRGIRDVYADGDQMYVENTYNRLVALDTRTGAPLWLLAIKAPLAFPPVSYKDTLYFFAAEDLYVVKRKTGEVILCKNPRLGVLVQPVAAPTEVLVGSANGKTHGVDPKDIWPKWTRALDALPIGLAFRAPNRCYVLTDESDLACIDTTTGAFIWRINLGPRVPVAGPTAHGNMLYIGGRDTFVHAFDSGGNLVWKTPVSGVSMYPPVVVGNRIICMLNPDAAAVLNAGDGKLLWRQRGPAHFLTVARERIYFLDAEKKRVLCYNLADGRPEGTIGATDFHVFAANPDNGRFVAASKQGEVYGYVDIGQLTR